MQRVFLVLVSVAALTGTAAAADLSRPAPQTYYKAPVVAPAYNWSGFYLGLNGGGAFGRSTWDTTGGFDISGGLVGATVGYNYQFGQAVAGVEADIDWADISGSSTTNCVTGCKTSDTWLSTVRGRLGYAADRFMPFITGTAAEVTAVSEIANWTFTPGRITAQLMRDYTNTVQPKGKAAAA